MSKVYIYVVARDFGFAPNPFHGCCTLATCKPRIRSSACIGDWVVGLGGTALKATGRCIFAMKVTDAMTFDEYWSRPEYQDKRPVRNGSRKMMIGDNVYHRSPDGSSWLQADSHHSRPDGSADPHNTGRDTSADRVLVSKHFFYFGHAAPVVPTGILSGIGYRNARNHRVFPMSECAGLIRWIEEGSTGELNVLAGRPFQYDRSGARFSVDTNTIIA